MLSTETSEMLKTLLALRSTLLKLAYIGFYSSASARGMICPGFAFSLYLLALNIEVAIAAFFLFSSGSSKSAYEIPSDRTARITLRRKNAQIMTSITQKEIAIHCCPASMRLYMTHKAFGE